MNEEDKTIYFFIAFLLIIIFGYLYSIPFHKTAIGIGIIIIAYIYYLLTHE